MTHHLLVPPAGLLEMWDGDINIEYTLTARGGEGTLVTLMYADVQMTWFLNELGPLNERARETLVLIRGPHAVFTGPVMFSGLPPDEVAYVIAHLSRKE